MIASTTHTGHVAAEVAKARSQVLRDELRRLGGQDGVLTAPPAPAIVEKGKAGPGLLAQVLISKYQDHLPLHRQEAIFARQGATIARSTMCDWVGACADRLKPLVELSHEALLRSFVVQADDTPVLC